MSAPPLWISESDVVALVDLPQAIEALEDGLKLQAAGGARNLEKTHLVWGGSHTLHAIGAIFETEGVLGTKTWAHTAGGATPLFVMWDANTGALLAVIEAFAMGQLRTAAMSGTGTRWMAAQDADTLALIGTGKQALPQMAAVAAVRKLKEVRVFGRDAARRDKFIETAKAQGFEFAIVPADSVEAAAKGASIITLATRARDAILFSTMAAKGAHINSIGAISPEREEFAQDIFARAGLVAADDPPTTRKLSREYREFYGDSDKAWEAVKPIATLVAEARGRPRACDLSVFKAMGMGISDLSLAREIYARAKKEGRGKTIDTPKKAAPRLRASPGGRTP